MVDSDASFALSDARVRLVDDERARCDWLHELLHGGIERLDLVLLQDLSLCFLAALFDEALAFLSLNAEGRDVLARRALQLLLLIGINQLKSRVLVQVHPCCDNTVAIRAEN